MQAHHTFDEDQVGLGGGRMQQRAAVRFATHPQVELIHRLAAGLGQDGWVEEIGAGLEHAHPAPLWDRPAGQRGGGGGLGMMAAMGAGLGGKAAAARMGRSVMKRGGSRAGRRLGIAMGGRFSKGLGKNLDQLSLETVKMFYEDAKQAGYKIEINDK